MSTKLKAGTATSGAVIDADTTGILELQSGSTPTTAITIDASQNVGVGTSSPTEKLVVSGNSIVTGTAPTFNVNGTGSATYGITLSASGANTAVYQYSSVDGSIKIGGIQSYSFPTFWAGNSERMRIDSSGNLLVGTTGAFQAVNAPMIQALNNTTYGQYMARSAQSSAGKYWHFGASANAFIIYNQGDVGQYMVDGATSWTANSDERLKDIIEPISDALNKVDGLRSVIGKYKTDEEGKRRSFLIAQDVQKVLPEAVNVQDDEIGTLGVQYTDVIPLLVAAIKELNAKVDAQAAEIASLKGAK